MKTHKKGLGLLAILALLLAWSFIGSADPIITGRVQSGGEWVLVASDDDIDNTAEPITELDTTFVQMAAGDNIYCVSSSASDITQTVWVSGITTGGKKVTESFTIAGTTYSAASTATYAYVDQTWVDIECLGTISISREDGVPTLINSIEIGSLKGDIGHHFNGEKVTYVKRWWADSTTTGQKKLELRWYPDDADCLDASDGFTLLDRIVIAGSVYSSRVRPLGTGQNGYKLPAGGWLAVYGTGNVADQEATVTVIGSDRSR